MGFYESLERILSEDGHWEVYKGQRITPLIHKADYAKYSEMTPKGLPRKKKNRRKKK